MKQTPPINSVAILPFLVLSPTNECEYLGDGLASEIINTLSKISTLKVTARTSSFSFKNEKVDAKKIGQALNVAKLVEGSVNISKDNVRVSVQLIDAADGFQLWAESYKNKSSIAHLLDLIEELTLEIVSQLKINLNTENQILFIKRTSAPAYKLYLEGLYHWNIWTYKHLQKAIDLFKQSIEIDSSFAAPYTGLANCWSLLGAIHRADPRSAAQTAKQYVLKALQLDDKLVESHVALGLILLLNDTDLRGAYYAFEKALSINSNSADAHHCYSFYLLNIGRTKKAIVELLTALRIDPLSPQINSTYGYALLVDEKYTDAITQFKKTLDLEPKLQSAMSSLCWAYMMNKEYDLAQHYLKENKPNILQPDATQSYLHALAGKEEDAIKSMKIVEKNEIKASLYRELSMCWIGLNDFEEADKCLNKFYKEKIGFAMTLSHPAWKPFRHDQRFWKYKKRLSLFNMPVYNPEIEVDDASVIVIKSGTREELILNISHLMYVKAESIYSRIVWQEEGILKSKILRATIGEIEKQVLNPKLVRCHRSYIVNTSIEYEITGKSRRYKVSYNDYDLKIPVSRNLEKEVLEKIIS